VEDTTHRITRSPQSVSGVIYPSREDSVKPKLKDLEKRPIPTVMKRSRMYDSPVLFPMATNPWQASGDSSEKGGKIESLSTTLKLGARAQSRLIWGSAL
jgi:hypothetical protein